jgi:hypothetical protein
LIVFLPSLDVTVIDLLLLLLILSAMIMFDTEAFPLFINSYRFPLLTSQEKPDSLAATATACINESKSLYSLIINIIFLYFQIKLGIQNILHSNEK